MYNLLSSATFTHPYPYGWVISVDRILYPAYYFVNSHKSA